MGDNKKLISSNTTTDTKTSKNADGTTQRVITTTTIETYSDGSTATKTKVQTITEGIQQIVDGKKTIITQNAKENAPKVPVTTDEKFIQDALKSHNEKRAKHGVPPLTLSNEICQVAQALANTQVAKKSMVHSQSGYGENFFWANYDVVDGNFPVEHWYSEIKDFNWAKPNSQKGTGFTQIVWKESKELGIAKAVAKDGSCYVVANYEPAGNVLGQFDKNVPKPVVS